jgi:hypothetical protein
MKRMMLIVACAVAGCSAQVEQTEPGELEQAVDPPSGPLRSGTYVIFDSSVGVWDLEWASTAEGARVFNRQQVAGATNEQFILTNFSRDLYTIKPKHSGLCLTTSGGSGVQNIIQHTCVTGQHAYVDQWKIEAPCGGPERCSYRFKSANLPDQEIGPAPGANVFTAWLPLELPRSFRWYLDSVH